MENQKLPVLKSYLDGLRTISEQVPQSGFPKTNRFHMSNVSKTNSQREIGTRVHLSLKHRRLPILRPPFFWAPFFSAPLLSSLATWLCDTLMASVCACLSLFPFATQKIKPKAAKVSSKTFYQAHASEAPESDREGYRYRGIERGGVMGEREGKAHMSISPFLTRSALFFSPLSRDVQFSLK